MMKISQSFRDGAWRNKVFPCRNILKGVIGASYVLIHYAQPNVKYFIHKSTGSTIKYVWIREAIQIIHEQLNVNKDVEQLTEILSRKGLLSALEEFLGLFPRLLFPSSFSRCFWPATSLAISRFSSSDLEVNSIWLILCHCLPVYEKFKGFSSLY